MQIFDDHNLEEKSILVTYGNMPRELPIGPNDRIYFILI